MRRAADDGAFGEVLAGYDHASFQHDADEDGGDPGDHAHCFVAAGPEVVACAEVGAGADIVDAGELGADFMREAFEDGGIVD